ncbi:unnamed protein product [Linum tenue]|uniref:RNase H type-1 domain-containing protein n=1 Tax=Linum tenue TaxID=586396 RepID=A0AAV0I0Q1_9ROSI|nr:unnamed protein product [Linum tenue]
MGHRRVRVELDSSCAVQLLRSKDRPDHHHAALIDRFQDLLARNWEESVSHIYREGNQCVDALAKRGHSLPFGFHRIEVSDPGLCNLLLYQQKKDRFYVVPSEKIHVSIYTLRKFSLMVIELP